MTNEQIRARIAEACGWKREDHGHYIDWTCPKGSGWYPDPPDYPNDLNACAEFEDTLNNAEILEYVQWLDRGALTKAPKRCEAFLKVKGLWEEA